MTCQTHCLEPQTAPAMATRRRPPTPRSTAAARRNRRGRFARSGAFRLAAEELLHRSKLLPETPRTILRAYLELKMPIEELALLHQIPPRILQRRIRRWREMLSDPDFLLAAQFGPHLAAPLAAIAVAHWVDGRSLRIMAAGQGVTIHHIRTQLARTRLELVKAAARSALPATQTSSEDQDA